MAKAVAAAAAAAVSNAAPSPFKVTFGEGPAPITRKVGAESSPYVGTMKGLPAPANGKFASFFIPTEPNKSLSGEEQQKDLADQQRRITNRVSGIARRLKKGASSYNFAVRAKEEDGVLGVRVYRIAA